MSSHPKETGVREGIIRFRLDHDPREVPPAQHRVLASQVIAWREILCQLALLGQEPNRYHGLGFGNVSARVPPHGGPASRRAFLITGTQTGGKACLSPADLALVIECVPSETRVKSRGLAPPSSEAMTHATLYQLGAHIRWVFHAHCPSVWRAAQDPAFGVPLSRASAEYGSAEMVREVRRLWQSSTLPETQIFAMGGHEDGIIAFGRSADEAGGVVLSRLARAYALECEQRGALCHR